jgi:hypothetical protein
MGSSWSSRCGGALVATALFRDAVGFAFTPPPVGNQGVDGTDGASCVAGTGPGEVTALGWQSLRASDEVRGERASARATTAGYYGRFKKDRHAAEHRGSCGPRSLSSSF